MSIQEEVLASKASPGQAQNTPVQCRVTIWIKGPAKNVILYANLLIVLLSLCQARGILLPLYFADMITSIPLFVGSCPYYLLIYTRLLPITTMNYNESQSSMTSLGLVGIVIFAFLLALDTVALGIRLRSRSLQGLSLCFNDYAMLLAWSLVAGLFVITVLDTIKGAVGQHLVNASPTEVTYSLKTIPIAGIIWITANTLIKTSILHFYNTVFGINRAFRHTTYVVAAMVVSFCIGTVLQEVLLCRPFAKNWNSHLPGVCGSSSATILAEAIINMLIDIAIILMPMPLVWGLQMTRRRKINFTIVVGLGLIICVITILRIVFAVQFDVNDITYAYYRISATTVLEPVLGIIVACLPMFPSAFNKGRVGGECPLAELETE